MHHSIRRGAVGAAAALALALVAPAAHGAASDGRPQPPSAHVVETGVPAGQTEHGVFISTNVDDPHWPYYTHVEYWATSDRWSVTVTDRAGHLVDRALGGPEGWTTYTGFERLTADGQGVVPEVLHSALHQLPPFPGYGAPGNREAIDNGWFVLDAGAPTQTVAGFTGVQYHQTRTRTRRGESDIVLLQEGTLQPLLRETKIAHPGGGGGPIDFQDRLVSRELIPSASSPVQLTHATFLRTIRGWRAEVKAYNQRQAKRRHARSHAPEHPYG